QLTRGRCQVTAHEVEERALAAATRPQQDDELAGKNLHVDVLERQNDAITILEMLADATAGQDRSWRSAHGPAELFGVEHRLSAINAYERAARSRSSSSIARTLPAVASPGP